MIVNVFTLILHKDDCTHGYFKIQVVEKTDSERLPVAPNYNFLNSITFYIVFLNLGMKNLEYWI